MAKEGTLKTFWVWIEMALERMDSNAKMWNHLKEQKRDEMLVYFYGNVEDH